MRRCLTIPLLVLTACMSACLSACTGIGVAGIVAERQDYNEAINYTSAQQTLANIVRTYNRENPTFVSVSDITSNKSLSANLNGGSNNIGALLPLGSLTSLLSANEQPVVKYVATTGYELIRQVSNPISLNDVIRLSSSNAPLLPLLVLALNRLTPEFGDYFRAISLINALDTLGAITIQQFGAEAVTIRFTARGLVRAPVAGNREDGLIACFGRTSSAALARNLWSQLSAIFRQRSADEVILYAGPSPDRDVYVLPRSAQGALSISNDGHDIAFLPAAEVERVILENEAREDCRQDFHFLGRGDLGVSGLWDAYYRLMSRAADGDRAQYDFRTLGRERALILVQVSASAPANAFVSYERRGVWYSIRDDDRVSKRNFSLLSTLTIIQAVPAAVTTQTVTAIPLRN